MIVDVLSLPPELVAGELDFEWSDASEHIAPAGETSLTRSLKGKTNSGIITMIAACVLISAHRLQRIGDVRRLHHLAECLLCFEASPLYYSGYRRPKSDVPPPPVEQVISAIFTRSTAVFQQLPGHHSSFPPMSAIKNVVALTKLVLGATHKRFLTTWLGTAKERLDRFAANPDQVFTTRSDYETSAEWDVVRRRNFGVPVPLEVMNGKRDLAAADLPRLYAEFLSGVRWQENPYLRQPEALVAAGFEGEPYRWSVPEGG